MDLHLRSFWRATEYDANRFLRSNVLLTGVTGFLGSHLLSQLMDSSQVRVVCLVRESAEESAEERVYSALSHQGLLPNKQLECQLSERVRIISGDIALIHFGLSEEHYHFLSYDVDVVIHAAAYVNLIYPYQALHGINVLGTRNVLDFCIKNKIKPLHYISTDAVIPHGLKGEMEEEFPIECVKEKLADGYAQSKYVAEQLVKRSMSRGLPAIIYRLGNQAASTTSGEWNPQDFTFLMLTAVLHTGKAPSVEWELELTPVDFSAAFICELATHRRFCEHTGLTFHLTNTGPTAPKWVDVMEWVRAMGFRIEMVPLREWMTSIAKSSNVALQRIQKLLEVMVKDEQFFSQQSAYKRTNTERVLREELKIAYPVVDERLVKRWVHQLVERGQVEQPRIFFRGGHVDGHWGG